jgi:alpha-tubulin suppressor-like RCC1 family protein
MSGINDDFIKKFLGQNRLTPQQQKDLLKKQRLQEYYSKKSNKIKNLDENAKKNISLSMDKIFENVKSKSSTEKIKTYDYAWTTHMTPYGVFYYNKEQKVWANAFGKVSKSFEELLTATAISDIGLDYNKKNLFIDYSYSSTSPSGGFMGYITSSGEVLMLGDFSPGSYNVQSGLYDYGQTTVPEGLGPCKQIACAYQHTLALKIDGTMVAWGYDASYAGKSGTEAIQAQLTAAGRTVKKIACGGHHNLALLDDGSVVVWGQNEGSQMSDPNTYWTPSGYAAQYNSVYVNHPELSGYLELNGLNQMKRTYRCSAIDNTRSPNNCESPYRSSPGFTAYDGSVIPAPTSVVGTGWETITNAPYDYQFARYTTGIIGHVNYSGGGWTRNPNTLSALGTSNKKYIDIAAGRTHNLLLTEEKTIETWGWNFYYVITGSGPHSADGRQTCNYAQQTGPNCFLRAGSGSGSIPWGDNTAPTVKNLKITPNSVEGIGTSYQNSAVIKSDGSLFVWDKNEYGESLPAAGLPTGTFTKVTGGYHHFVALKSDGTVVCWGENDSGQCNVPEDLTSCVDIGAGKTYSYARKSDGTLVFWGNTQPLGGAAAINAISFV